MKLRKRKPIGKYAVRYIERLYALYSKRLFFVAKNYVKDSDLAEDIMQTVFEKALLYPNSILKVPEEEISYFLIAMVKNTAYSFLKEEKQNVHEALTYDDRISIDYVEDPNDNYLQLIDLHALKEKLNKLPEQQRDILLFRYVYGFKCKEIADMFHMSERNVKAKCSEARKNLRRLLARDKDI